MSKSTKSVEIKQLEEELDIRMAFIVARDKQIRDLQDKLDRSERELAQLRKEADKDHARAFDARMMCHQLPLFRKEDERR